MYTKQAYTDVSQIQSAKTITEKYKNTTPTRSALQSCV